MRGVPGAGVLLASHRGTDETERARRSRSSEPSPASGAHRVADAAQLQHSVVVALGGEDVVAGGDGEAEVDPAPQPPERAAYEVEHLHAVQPAA